MRTAPYSPCSNGAAENAVKTVKNALKKLSSDPAFQRKSVALQLSSYLEMYRATKHATTGESPFKLMFGREMRIRFDKLKADPERRQREAIEEYNVKKKNVNFEVGETVYARDYRNPKKPLWMRARVIKKLGAVLYECLVAELGVIKRRSHQLLKYPFDDYEEDTKRTNNNDVQLPNEQSDDEMDYVSISESDAEEQTVQPRPAGSYVTRYNRVVTQPRRFGGE